MALSNKYFSYSAGSKTNILSPGFFESYTFKSSSNYVNVTGNANNIKNFEITEISSVATAASFASTKKVAASTVQSDEIVGYVSALAGESMTLEYGGKSHTIKIDAGFGKGNTRVGLQDVVNELNQQLEKIDKTENGEYKLFRFGLDGDKIKAVGADEEKTVKLTAAGKNIINSLNLKTGQEAESTSEIVGNPFALEAKDVFSSTDSYITFEYNGVLKQIKMKAGLNDASEAAKYIQEELDKTFGKDKVIFEYKDNGFALSAKDDSNVVGISSISKNLSNLTGLESGDYNRVNKNKAIEDAGLVNTPTLGKIKNDKGEEVDGYKIKINDKEISIQKGTSLNDIIKKINNQTDINVYYSATTNTFSVISKETGEHKGVSIEDVEGNLAEALFGEKGTDYTVNAGTDTKITYKLNGVENTVTRSTTNFTIDEVNIELNEKAKNSASAASPITFDVTNNSDEVVERVKKFIDEYNEIMNLIGTKTKEKPSRSYLPLTPEQQDDMKEDEIKNWNEEAKKGSLYGDRNMNNLLGSLKRVMASFTDVSTISLASIGISSASMDTSGKLVFDEKKFKEKLLENPDEIAKLFTGTSTNGENGVSGIAVQLKKILVKNVGEYGNTGVLIEEAGLPGGMTADQNFISKKMKEYDDKMATLKKSLEAERTRYWKQFAALEDSLNKLNAQSSWLTDMMGN